MARSIISEEVWFQTGPDDADRGGRVKNVKTTYMKAHTFIGQGDTGALLLIEPTYEATDETHIIDYDRDAMVLASFLESMFCTKTLEALKKHLLPGHK
jgi:hypothetical protein